MPNDKEYDKTIKLRISERLLEDVRAVCKRKGIGMSEYIRNVLEKSLADDRRQNR